MGSGFLDNVDGQAREQVLRDQTGTGIPPDPGRPLPDWVDSLPPGVRDVVKVILEDFLGYGGTMILETSRVPGQKSKEPWMDDHGNLHCGLGCNQFISPRTLECAYHDRGGNAPPRWTPRRIAKHIQRAQERGELVDPGEIGRKLWDPLPPDDRLPVLGGGEIGIWDENGFVGFIEEGAQTDEGLDITRIGDTNVRVEPVDRSIIRDSIHAVAIGGAQWGADAIKASAEGDWVRVWVRNPKSGEKRSPGVIRREHLADFVNVYEGGPAEFHSAIVWQISEVGLPEETYKAFPEEEMVYGT